MNKELISKKVALAIEVHAELSEKECHDIAFHMTDWLNELECLCDVFSNIEECDSEKIYKMLLSFLIHAPEHVSEAARITTGFGVENIFVDKKFKVFTNLKKEE